MKIGIIAHWPKPNTLYESVIRRIELAFKYMRAWFANNNNKFKQYLCVVGVGSGWGCLFGQRLCSGWRFGAVGSGTVGRLWLTGFWRRCHFGSRGARQRRWHQFGVALAAKVSSRQPAPVFCLCCCCIRCDGNFKYTIYQGWWAKYKSCGHETS